ncbi:MAG: hypothetical protein WCR55_07475 [Lentisphaerota bacterium]
MQKVNCWEKMRCGQDLIENSTHEMEVCPAYLEKKADGFHGGVNGGRCCWVIAKTICDSKVAGAMKMLDCLLCDFYLTVKAEEGSNFRTYQDIRKSIKY